MNDFATVLPQRTLFLFMAIIHACCWQWYVSECNSQEVDFASQIRPLLNRHCIACHGPDEEHRQADLRLDTFDDGADQVIVPGGAEESEFIQRITSDDEGYVMPPPEHSQLSSDEIELLRRWIDSGAAYTQHWSFINPQRHPIPQAQFDGWGNHEIDYFVAEKLAVLGLKPSPSADSLTLLRRLSLDLTGLPPNDDQVARFQKNSDLASYEAMVDELLASPAFGEHWAAMWLDLARYADTIGYTEDHPRTIWPWRDWVIQAFNDNMPFDQFTVEQLAGDLLPGATERQQLATAFHRNTVSNSEGGTIDEEFRVIAVKDRINTTINVWMGLTMRCAECHTHKYDPISIQEYYRFYDFFNQTADADRSDEEPRMHLLSDEQRRQIAQLDDEILQLTKAWEAQPKPWSELTPVAVTATQPAEFRINDDLSVSLLGTPPTNADISVRLRLPAGTYHGIRLEVLPEPATGNRVGLSSSGNFILSQIAVEIADGTEAQTLARVEIADAAADFSQDGYDIRQTIGGTGEGSGEGSGWAVYGAPGGMASPRVAVFSFDHPLVLGEQRRLQVELHFRNPQWPQHIMSRFRIGAMTLDRPAEKLRQNQLDPIQDRIVQRRQQRADVSRAIQVPVMQELPSESRRVTRLMTRGSYLSPGEELTAEVLEAFHPLVENLPRNRLGAARWLMDPANPLTSRVTVNRFWARIFGRGIVETEEDFGLQGSIPTHPELLDWLALDFQENGWDVKRLLKQLVLSSTYRQTNQATSDRQERDPLNRFYSRASRVRLSAEVLRDQSLMVSGLLESKLYGPPVFPPSPIKVIRNSFAGDFIWKTSLGEDRYRRAIYTYLKRSQPHPLFDTFDMATRQVCSFRRIPTNTPLQSFMTLNDEAFVECAQHLARGMQQHTSELEQQLRWGLQTALRQPPDPQQVKTLQHLVQSVRQVYSADRESAKLLTGLDAAEIATLSESQLAELASLTVAANVILNLDGMLTK